MPTKEEIEFARSLPCEIVGCYTAGDYEEVANEYLHRSVHMLALPHDIREIPNRGSWVLNNSACQLFLRQIHEEKPHTNFLYVDVDGYVHSDPWPFLLALDCDIGVHFLGRELLSGTVYLPAVPRRGELLDRWIAKNEKQPSRWDQKNLQDLLVEDPSFSVHRLPPEYCFIYDIHRRWFPSVEKPVIEHFQASRRFKHRVKGIRDDKSTTS